MWYQLSIQCSLEFHYYTRMASLSVSYMFFSISHKSHSSEILHTFDTFCNSSPKSFYETAKLNTDKFSRIYEKSVTLSLVNPNDRQINASWTCIKFICNEKWNCFLSRKCLGLAIFWDDELKGFEYAPNHMLHMIGRICSTRNGFRLTTDAEF